MSSTSSVKQLDITLDPSSGVPFYRQIIRWIENAVLSGRLAPGERLPTIRSLAIELTMNPNTIAKAYAELELRGIVATQVGNGTYVARGEHTESPEGREAAIADVLSRFVGELTALGVDREEIPDLIRDYMEE